MGLNDDSIWKSNALFGVPVFNVMTYNSMECP